ncbi:S-layer homology domain-containing protein [Sporosarcina sp. P19]|uniref:S-layer homology domain-containing protein n=1 Tax=Sporosarcina sp. P19 TaxID=2048258 RepID=UPI0013044E91|nr:S-layer homology domain-containing protein [Sporosarcina sp. P19]
MKRKITASFIALLCIVAAMPFQAHAAKFTDMNGHWAKKEIQYLYDRNIIGGYPDGTFKPNEPITRAQAFAMLIKALKIPLVDNPKIVFKDVSKKSSYYKIMATVNEKGILRGDQGLMRPGENTSRAQMAAILRRSFNIPFDSQPTFVDVVPAHWAYADINGIAKQRIAGGSEGKYMPSQSVTRAQFSAFLTRALDDSMKLGRYHSYVSKKGKTVEQNGFSYSIRNGLMKKDLKTDKSEEILSKLDFEGSDGIWISYMENWFDLIVYNDEVFIPYLRAIGQASELPMEYGVIRTKTERFTGPKDSMIMPSLSGETMRNVFIWNDRIYYTNEATKRDYYRTPNIPIDSKLTLNSVAMNGSDRKKERDFDARILFYEDPKEKSFIPNENQNNASVLFDHSTMFYFNKTGIYKYSLLEKKTSKLSNIQGKHMSVTDKQLIVTSQDGKKYVFKK